MPFFSFFPFICYQTITLGFVNYEEFFLFVFVGYLSYVFYRNVVLRLTSFVVVVPIENALLYSEEPLRSLDKWLICKYGINKCPSWISNKINSRLDSRSNCWDHSPKYITIFLHTNSLLIQISTHLITPFNLFLFNRLLCPLWRCFYIFIHHLI